LEGFSTLPDWTFDRKRISANSNLHPNSNPNPKAQKRVRENEMTSFFRQVSRYHVGDPAVTALIFLYLQTFEYEYLKISTRVVLSKGVGRKISRGAQRKKDRKIAKNDGKIALLSLFQGSQRKKDQKIALLSFYLLYLYHV